MPEITRFIFRLDYDNAYSIVDRPGHIMALLAGQKNTYWEELGEAHDLRQITGRTIGKEMFRTTSVSPNTINGTFECLHPVEFTSADFREFLTRSNQLLEELITDFKLSNMNRVGIRFFLFHGKASKKNIADKLKQTLGEDRHTAWRSKIGNIQDFSLTLHGITDSALEFRLTCGPYDPSDRVKFLDTLRNNLSGDLPEYAVSLDLDLFDHKIQLRSGAFSKWVDEKWPFVEHCADFAAQQIVGM